MTYCTVAEVKSEFKNIDTTAPGSFITDAEITDFIAQEAGLINTYIGGLYILPISPILSPNAFNFLKKICIDCVACRIEKILNLKKPVNFKPQKEIKQEMNECDMCAQGLQMLEDVKNGKILLPDATNKGNLYASSYTASNQIEPIFYRDRDQW